MKGIRKLWAGIFILCLVTPLGLMASGDAWGEWGRDFFKEVFGFVPEGLSRYSQTWSAPLADYTIPGLGQVPGYIISALAGIFLVAAITCVLARCLSIHNK